MKKIIVEILSLIVLIINSFFMTLTPCANVNIGSNTAERGDTVEIIVTVSNCDTVKSAYICPIYDAEALELVDAEWLLTGAALSNWDNAAGDGAIAYSEATDINGKVMKLIFKVSDVAAFGTYPVNCEFRTKNGQTDIPVSVSSGTIGVL